MEKKRIRWRAVSAARRIVTNNSSDTELVVGENAAAPEDLCSSMLGCLPPTAYGVLVPEEGERQELARVGEALKPLDRYKPLRPLEHRLELGRNAKISIDLPLGRSNFEDHRDHRASPWGAEASLRKVRSSRSRNFSA
jgi:hypothetical protein